MEQEIVNPSYNSLIFLGLLLIELTRFKDLKKQNTRHADTLQKWPDAW